jgi:hypothetical protein
MATRKTARYDRYRLFPSHFWITMPVIEDDLNVCAVDSRAQMRDFIAVPRTVYRQDPNWVNPLILEQKQRFSDKNPFFEHARWRAWVAYRHGKPVGRISAQIDQLHLQQYQDRTGHFGCLEAEDDSAVFTALAMEAENWLKEQGLKRVTGPFNLSINEECGLLVEGFDTPPCIMMGHGRPYYGQQLENLGFRKAKDLLAYHMAPDFDAPRIMATLARKESKRIRLRPLNRKDLKNELNILREIFNDAWSQNWGFVPFTKAEFEEAGKSMMLIIEDGFIQIAEVDGEPAAMMVTLPNINEAIRDLNGRLLPFGWLKLLWRLKIKRLKTARVPLMGVRKKYQHSRLGPTLAFMLIDSCRRPAIRHGIRDVEMSWILEDNAGMRNILESIGGIAYKRYRLYEKSL